MYKAIPSEGGKSRKEGESMSAERINSKLLGQPDSKPNSNCHHGAKIFIKLENCKWGSSI
jgi:hypothetical protein